MVHERVKTEDDADNQLEVLSALDKARTQWYHFTAICIAGLGFFTHAYDLFCISTVSKLLGRIYFFDPEHASHPGVLPPSASAAVNGAALSGTLLGRLFFGWLGDRMGRKKVYGVTLKIMVICSLASGLSFCHTAKGVMATICFFRFWLGFGIGGDYPLSATIMAEYANQRTRGSFIAAVFAMQGTGIVAGGTASIIVSVIFNIAYPSPSFKEDPVASTPPEADVLWRVVFMLGAIPAFLTYYWRMKMPETARYTALVEGNARQAAMDMAKVMAVDLSNLFQKDIFSGVGWLPEAENMSAIEEVFRISRAQVLIAICSTLAGYWFTVLTIDWLGRRPIQLMGFAMMTGFMLALAIPYYALRERHLVFLILYAFTFFFANFGPNTTTFIIPAELFPARMRSTCHGISAAAGKAGAIVGAFGFLYAAQSSKEGQQDHGYPTGLGVRTALIILGIINGQGFLCTFLVPETKGLSLEDISGENAEKHSQAIDHPRTILFHPW
ncbi:hypothetical protein KP509_34G061200 [Ceratopteris richardii]|uniref:Major facilitator superfamily (MFS) profile domain-containing protein n=1 Tax=Ceratopteris richardii TaxID=49495 RepID=A0A8T2QKK5_CERRI|nr:hypothetical protein KP509_34G061200 [Ceratopteris richardii]